MFLNTNEYNESYFDGKTTKMRNNAGYPRYERWDRMDGANSLGEFFKDEAKKIFDDNNIFGKKVLEIGCAKGFVVEDLREMGVDCYGLDVSSYAIGKAAEVVKPFLTIGDARTYLSNYSDNEFDLVFSQRVLECFNPKDLPNLISEMNRISKSQYHLINETSNSYYNEQPLEEWSKLGFEEGIIFVNNQRTKTVIK